MAGQYVLKADPYHALIGHYEDWVRLGAVSGHASRPDAGSDGCAKGDDRVGYG
jgi:hypothetical protein